MVNNFFFKTTFVVVVCGAFYFLNVYFIHFSCLSNVFILKICMTLKERSITIRKFESSMDVLIIYSYNCGLKHSGKLIKLAANPSNIRKDVEPVWSSIVAFNLYLKINAKICKKFNMLSLICHLEFLIFLKGKIHKQPTELPRFRYFGHSTSIFSI